MGCYFGCGTNGNRFAYCLYFTLALAGIGCFSYWGYSTGECFAYQGGASSACEIFANATGELSTSPDYQSAARPTTAEAAISESCASTGWPVDSIEYTSCVECLSGIYGCLASSWPWVVVAIILVVATALPCFFCCCCANPPKNPYSA